MLRLSTWNDAPGQRRYGPSPECCPTTTYRKSTFNVGVRHQKWMGATAPFITRPKIAAIMFYGNQTRGEVDFIFLRRSFDHLAQTWAP